MTGQADYLELGDWNATCSMCGRKRKASSMVKNWQGQYRCPEHNEPRHPQDFVKAVTDNQSVPWSQPQTDTFQTGFCVAGSVQAISDIAAADCAISDLVFPS